MTGGLAPSAPGAAGEPPAVPARPITPALCRKFRRGIPSLTSPVATIHLLDRSSLSSVHEIAEVIPEEELRIALHVLRRQVEPGGGHVGVLVRQDPRQDAPGVLPLVDELVQDAGIGVLGDE